MTAAKRERKSLIKEESFETHQGRVFALGAAGVKSLRGILQDPGPDDDVSLADRASAAVLEIVEYLRRVVGGAVDLVGNEAGGRSMERSSHRLR